MWNLVVDENSNRFFIKHMTDNRDKYYIVKEDSIIVNLITYNNLKDNYRLVGNAFESESKRLNRLLEDTVF